MIDLSKLVNGRLLPELRKLGVPCPNETCHVLQPATEHHSFCITTQVHAKTQSPRTWPQGGSVNTQFLISQVSPSPPTDMASLSELGIDVAEKRLQVEDPEFYRRALAIITTRWRAMQRYDDIRLLRYFEEHSQSERALFNQDHVNRLLELAGQEPTMDIPWISLPYETAITFIKAAQQRLELTSHLPASC